MFTDGVECLLVVVAFLDDLLGSWVLQLRGHEQTRFNQLEHDKEHSSRVF